MLGLKTTGNVPPPPLILTSRSPGSPDRLRLMVMLLISL